VFDVSLMVGVVVQRGGRQPVDNLQHPRIAQGDARRREQFGIQGVELIWVGMRPERQAVHAPNDLERPLKGLDDVFPREAILLSSDPGEAGGILQGHDFHDFFHLGVTLLFRRHIQSTFLLRPPWR